MSGGREHEQFHPSCAHHKVHGAPNSFRHALPYFRGCPGFAQPLCEFSHLRHRAPSLQSQSCLPVWVWACRGAGSAAVGFFFLSPPFLTARCELRVEENQPAVRVRGGAAAAADEREGGQRGSHGARYCTATDFRFPPQRRREFNHLFAQIKSVEELDVLLKVFIVWRILMCTLPLLAKNPLTI